MTNVAPAQLLASAKLEGERSSLDRASPEVFSIVQDPLQQFPRLTSYSCTVRRAVVAAALRALASLAPHWRLPSLPLAQVLGSDFG